MRYTLRQLEIFIAVARHESVSRAADALALSQSATSTALGELERQFDTQLFDRIGKALRLNEAGHVLLPHAVQLIEHAREIESMLARQTDFGPLQIGATLTVGNYLATLIAADFLRRHPSARVGLSVHNSATIMHQLLHYELDLGLIEGTCRHPDLLVDDVRATLATARRDGGGPLWEHRPSMVRGPEEDGVAERRMPKWDDVGPLLGVIQSLFVDLASSGRWRVKCVGDLTMLPPDMAQAIRDAELASAGNPGMQVNVAIAYGGRYELRDAVRKLLRTEAEKGTDLAELADTLEIDDISEHVYTAGQPDPDLIIRTSGEQRLSGFMMWQSAHSEFYFCEALWPDFRRVDFLRALRSYTSRERRYGR